MKYVFAIKNTHVLGFENYPKTRVFGFGETRDGHIITRRWKLHLKPPNPEANAVATDPIIEFFMFLCNTYH